ncbi:MAG: diacylglycerol kinase [Xanthomonadales bacterium]|nr:diacylglycerol kinase [Gammaproteobacteria bacterium]MBT8052491.1 diacylglycerol kinase [Gammaproteobacteria bacterium]NND57135.1 diacylglycerol kinase [Xanthomonadales bacterium]NNK52785.1 diacylglycerol kinase [Xanthomonadales bacterium]
MKHSKTGIVRLFNAAGYSIAGIRACWQNEAAFRQDVMLASALFVGSFFLARSVEQWLLLVFPLFLILMVELLNSAIENVVDRIGQERHQLSGRAKDMGSAAVLFCLVLIAINWVAIAWKNFY